jgi:hypothetical protein
MKLQFDVRPFLATVAAAEARPAAPSEVDLRRLPWEDGSFAAIELDDVPSPDAWTVSGPALNEVRRVLARRGMLEVRTRALPGDQAQAAQKAELGLLTRLLQNHGFEIVSSDPARDDDGWRMSVVALRSDGPEDVFEDAVAATRSHVTLHGPLLDGGEDAAAGRALAATLDAQGVKVRVRVIFDVLDALCCD